MINFKRKQVVEQFVRASNDSIFDKNFVIGVAGVSLSLASLASQAAIDVSAVSSGITDAASAVAVIGAAVVLVVLGIKVFKWVQRSL